MRPSPLRGLTSLLLLGALLAPQTARGRGLDAMQREMDDLEQQTRNLNIRYKAETASLAQMAESRLVDAQVLYSMKDYTRAAILFLDYVNKYKGSPGYPEALFFLADSLYHKRDFLSAKRFFQQIVNDGTHNQYYQEALQRLVELSLKTGDTKYIERYLGQLANIPTAQLKPTVPYVRAKYYYFKDQLDQAVAGFRQIPLGHDYYFHAQYFLGAAMVRRKDYAGATRTFQGILQQPPKTKAEQHIRDLAYLGLGRILYEKGQTAKAIEMYQKVPRTSSEFDAALYEIAWAYVKEQEYRKAQRALELLVVANPDSPFVPEVKVLQGNLLIRLKDWGAATSLFSGAREKFMPVYTRRNQVLSEHRDPNLFFDLLLTRDESRFAIQIKVPRLAVHWVQEKPHVKKALVLVRDVREINESIKEATALLKKLDRVINSPAKIRIFPEFADAKAKALEVENRLILVRTDILEAERDLVMGKASGEQLSQLHGYAAQRGKLERQIRELPKAVEEYAKRQEEQVKKIIELEKLLNRLAILVQNQNAQLVAVEKYFADTATKREKGVQESFAAEAGTIRQTISGLVEEVEELSSLLADARGMSGVGGTEEVAERATKARYNDLVRKEHALLASLRAGLAGGRGGQFDALARLMDRGARVEGFIFGFDKKLETLVEQKLATIRTTIDEEKVKVGRYETELLDYKKQTDDVAGFLTYEGFRSVAQRFYEIVVRADVGIIDVAWALKDTKSKEVSKLVRQRKRDMKMLDDEFREVLRDE